MSPDDLRASAIEIWGDDPGWIAALAAALGIYRTLAWRYVTSRTRVPVPVSAAVSGFLFRFRLDGVRPPAAGEAWPDLAGGRRLAITTPRPRSRRA